MIFKSAMTAASIFLILTADASAQDVFGDIGKSLDISTQILRENIELNIRATNGLDIGTADRFAKAVSLDPRIVGGHPFKIEDAPWQVALIKGYAPEPGRFQFCGGSIVSANWVVTAAHCIVNPIVQQDPSRVDVVAGTAFYQYSGERLDVSNIIVHESYDANKQDFDIALLKVSGELTRGTPIAVASNGSSFPAGSLVTVTGWGALSEGSIGSDELLGVDVPLVSNEVCNSQNSYSGEITSNMLCAGQREGGFDSCQGDSGGPLVSKIASPPTLVGIVSWGEGCGRRLKYGVYTRVSEFSNWIAQKMSSN